MLRFRSIMRGLMGAFFVAAGVNHFRRPDLYLMIMPPYLPAPRELVALSGYAEIALGVIAWVPGLRRLARWGLIALLIAVFPANLHMALNTDQYGRIPAWLLWLRLPLQAALVAWVVWCTQGPNAPHNNAI